MTKLLGDQAVATRVLEHIANKSTDQGDEVWREPVKHYRCNERFGAETTQVLRRYPAPFCPSAALTEPGSYLARDAAGTPIVVVRGSDGVVRAFRNACRHRGAQVAEGRGCAKAFRCPYHGWAYRLDGQLQHVPHEQGFPNLEKSEHGLVAVTAIEKGGVVYVVQDDARVDMAETLSIIPNLFSAEQQLFDTHEYDLAVNWKIFLESFLEGYHIKPAHKETFFPFGYDNLTLAETFGNNSRITFPFQRIERLADVPSHERDVRGLLTYVYQLFPNVIVAVLSHHITMVVLDPLAVDKTHVIVYSLTPAGEQGEATLQRARNDAEFVKTTGQSEDIALVQSIQASLHSLANEAFTFGHFEPLLTHFHRTLSGLLK